VTSGFTKVLRYTINFSQKSRQKNPLQVPQKGSYKEGGPPTGNLHISQKPDFSHFPVKELSPRPPPRNLLRERYPIPRDPLTVHLSITIDNDQFDAQNFNTFITILYMYMFRAISCSSSRGQIVLIQHLVSSLSVSDRPVHRLRKNSEQFFLNLCIGRSLTESDDTRCCINTI